MRSIIEWDKVSSDQIEGRYRTSESATPGLFAELHPHENELKWRKPLDAVSMRTLAVYVERPWSSAAWSGERAIDQDYAEGDTVSVAYPHAGDLVNALVPSGETLTRNCRMEIGPGGYVYPASDLSASGGRARLQLMAGPPGKVTAPRLRVVVRVVG